MSNKLDEMYPEFKDPITHPRHTGIPSFMRCPIKIDDYSDVDIGLIGVPFDGGVTYRTGTRLGPREVRDWSSITRKLSPVTGIAPYDLTRVADIGDAWVRSPFELEGSHKEIQMFFEGVHKAGVTPLAVGGDHSISLPILRAIAKDRPVGMVHIDAHCDTCDDYMGSKFHHGAPFRRAVEEGLLDPKRTIQIGIRGGLSVADQYQFSYDSGMRVVEIEEFKDKGLDSIIEEARRVVGDGPTYISFDIDSLDPAFAPGTGTPEIGGMTSLEAQRLIRGLRGLDLIGGDVVEVAPPFDPSGVTALAAATIMWEMLCVIAESVASKK